MADPPQVHAQSAAGIAEQESVAGELVAQEPFHH